MMLTTMAQVVAAVIIVLLFFLRSTRVYFQNKPQPEAEEDDSEEESSDDEESDGESDSELSEGDEQDEAEVKQSKPAAIDKPKSKAKTGLEVTIRQAVPEDADTIHALMLISFEEYRVTVPPSSALEETSEGILEVLQNGGESAAILYEDDTAVAMVRYKFEGDAIYFFRLSVIPSKRLRGYAKQLVKWIEHQGTSKGMNASRCKVRQTVQNNVRMYQDLGYEIVDQELVVRPTGSVKALTLEKSLRPQ
ncbi:GNAT family N-acetyltransferase [Cohnella yongneupensis]|uniref:GNAT family N-acetyltransferase n=1 Tax=Cohnella yongneupensis TaxID=425006 RepID=A0ABW0QWK3_9BACL